MARFQDVLDRQLLGTFTGRADELNALLGALASDGPLVVFLHGIAGIGKSRLLERFAHVARGQGAVVISLDCRTIEPTEAGLLRELSSAVGGPATSVEAVAARLGQLGHRVIVALDTYETFRLMDSWLRQVFLPALPDNVRFVFCGREAPVTAWRSSFGWQGLSQTIALESLGQRDAMELLARLGVDPDEARRLDGICHGHPLALTLAASIAGSDPAASFQDVAEQKLVGELSRIYLADITDPQTRGALEAASVVRRVTVPIFSALLPDTSPQDAQERIRALPFVQSDKDGLRIHEAVRESIAAMLRSQDPVRYRIYRRAAYRHFMTELRGALPGELWRFTADLLYLLENPVVREAFFPTEAREYSVEPARAEDGEEILAIVDRHEGPEGRRSLAGWWNAMPEAFSIARDRTGAVVGFYCCFDPQRAPSKSAEDDPIVRTWLNHLHDNPMPKKQRILFLRRWLAAETGEAPSAIQAACWLDIKRRYLELRPELRRVYLTVRDLAPYGAVAQRLGFEVLPERTIVLDDRSYHTAMLDFGPSSVDGWLARLVAVEMGVEEGELLDTAARELVVQGRRIALTKLEFGVMELLERRSGEAVPRIALLESVWGQTFDGGSNVVDVVIRGLRKKLGDQSRAIETVQGVGYRLRHET